MASTIEVDQVKHSSGVAFTLPTADGSAGHLLKTNGSRVLSFTADTDTGILNVVEDTSPQLGGFLDANGNYIQMQKGGDIASASPTVIDTDGDYFICTGTTGFSAFTVAADRHFFLEFAGALAMTHGAGTLDLPGGANITTAASDVGEFVSTAANVVTCVNYTKASGKPVVTDFSNADINASAAIAQSKLVDVVNADVDASAAIATSKLSGAVTSIASHGLGALATLASVDTGQIAADAVTGAKIEDDAIDSEHYVDGSIDNAHIADDAIDSEHYADGSIDTAHIATNQIDETLMKDAFVGDFTDATVTASDYFIHGDATDSGNTKKDTVQGILDLVTVASLDATPDTDHTANGPQTSTLNAGYSSTLMDLVYLNANGKWLEADADATGTSINLLGIAMEAKTDGQAMNVALSGSFVRDDTWNWTIGVPLYVSGTLGAITATKPSGSGDVVRTVGYAVTADVIFFNPSSDYVTLA